MVDWVHQVAPNVRCLEAVEAEYLGKLDVYVPKLSHLSLWYPRFDQVRKEGAELWFYVCCHPLGRYPNRFLDHSLLKTRVLFWIEYGLPRSTGKSPVAALQAGFPSEHPPGQ